MNNNEWITDRLPTLDEWYVYDRNGGIVRSSDILNGEPWKPIPPCEPYVRPKRWKAEYRHGAGCWVLTDDRPNLCTIGTLLRVNNDKHREAAERIAAVYEEVMP